MSKTTILIVEDEAIVAADLASKLGQLGYEVVGTAARGEEAVELACRLKPEVVLMDIWLMGPMDGIEAAETIRRRVSAPVIYLTAHSDSTTLERAKVSEPFGYILKPFEERELSTTIEMALYKHQSERQLRESEEKYRTLFNTLMEGFCIIEVIFDPDGRPVDYRFLEINPAFAVLTGLQNAQGRLMRELAPDHEAYWFEIYGKVALTGESARFMNEARALNRWYDVYAYRIGQPEEPQVAVIFNDITDRKKAEDKLLASRKAALNLMEDAVIARKKAEETSEKLCLEIAERERTEEELVQAKEAAEAASRAKSLFLANMSHELRTPMTGVLGMLEFTLKTPLDAQQQDFIETAHKSARTLLRILNDILDLSKVEAGKLLIEVKPFALRECVAGAVDILLPEARRKGLELDCEMADDIPKTVIGDHVRLLQVLANLLGNAVKYTDRGRVKITVTLVSQSPAGKREINFIIADSGIGIPADKKELIFKSFTQADESHARRYGGVGLGLAISRELVERMGGTISCESKEGEGSTFIITIPLAEAPAMEETAAKQVTAAPPVAGVPVSSGDKVRGRLLLAEDDPITRKVIGMMLKHANFDHEIAENGLRAVEMWEKGNYDLVLMDVQMPGQDGFAATGAIRERERERGGHTLIVAMTAHAFPEDEKRCLAAGMDAYIPKPIDLQKCIEIINELIGKRDQEV
jgi:PAS domain S-box-containing protein